jgi:hypothetical protein
MSARGFAVIQLVVLLIMCTLTGCASLPPDLRVRPATSAVGVSLLGDWFSPGEGHRTLQGVARVRVKTAERSVSGSQIVLAEVPDRLRAETLSPFGTPLLVLAAHGPELSVLLPGDNRFYRGQSSPANLGRFTRLPLRLDDLVGILLAQPPLIGYQDVTTYLLQGGGWQVELNGGVRRQELVFDASRQLADVRYFYRGELQLHLAYNAYQGEYPGVPRRIDLVLPRQSTEASLVFSEITVGGAILPSLFSLTPSPDAVVVNLDEMNDSKLGGSAVESPLEELSTPREVVR